MLEKRLDELKNVDWDFSDYKGISSFPTDINSLHWYPAPFVPQIPAILIQVLTKHGDTILDPFAGAGVAFIEALKLNRRFIGIDINPFAVNIMRAKYYALSLSNKQWFSTIKKEIESIPAVESIEKYLEEARIEKETLNWFESKTLAELCTLHRYVTSDPDKKSRLLKETLFSSILNKCCSQRDHYTYITDGCYPKELQHIDALKHFLLQAEIAYVAAEAYRKQYRIMHNEEWVPRNGIVRVADARSLDFLKSEEVDMVVTSPPYLGVNDYIKSMRLTWLFFPNDNLKEYLKNEIGARRKRGRKYAYEEYVDDLDRSFSEISRVLKPEGFLCLILGKGSGRVNKRNVIEELIELLRKKHKFTIGMRSSRTIKFRRIQLSKVGVRIIGVGNEEIIVLNRRLIENAETS